MAFENSFSQLLARKKIEKYSAILNNFVLLFTCKGYTNIFPIYTGLENVTYVFFLKTLFEDPFNRLKDESELKT